MTNFLIEQITRSEFEEFIVSTCKRLLVQPTPQPEEVELKTRKETAKKLGVSLVTLNEYTKNGIIPAYRIGSRVRYKSTDVEMALVKVSTQKYRRLK